MATLSKASQSLGQQTSCTKPPVNYTTDVDVSLFSLSISDNPNLNNRTPTKAVARVKSAEAKTNKNKQESRLKPLPYETSIIPNSISSVTLKIQPDRVVCFSGKHFLSSFYPCSFEFNGITYQSVEHYHQATKLYATCGFEEAARIQHIREPFQAKKFAREVLLRHRVPSRAIDAWKQSDGLVTLIYAVALKFIQNRDLREQLLATKDKLLVQSHAGDNFYAAGMNAQDFEFWVKEHAGETLKFPYHLNQLTLRYFPLMGNGQNLLGVLNMKVREEIMNADISELYDRESIDRLLIRLTS